MESAKLEPTRKRLEIVKIRRKQQELTNQLMQPKKMVSASLYQSYQKCGQPNCRCHRGKPHGPYWFLSYKQDGKTKLIKVKDKAVLKLGRNWRSYQKNLTQWRQANKRIDRLLVEIRDGQVIQPGDLIQKLTRSEFGPRIRNKSGGILSAGSRSIRWAPLME